MSRNPVHPQRIHEFKRTLFEFGIPQVRLARAAGVDPVHLSRQLNGRVPIRPERETWLRGHLDRLVAEAVQRNAPLADTG